MKARTVRGISKHFISISQSLCEVHITFTTFHYTLSNYKMRSSN